MSPPGLCCHLPAGAGQERRGRDGLRAALGRERSGGEGGGSEGSGSAPGSTKRDTALAGIMRHRDTNRPRPHQSLPAAPERLKRAPLSRTGTTPPCCAGRPGDGDAPEKLRLPPCPKLRPSPGKGLGNAAGKAQPGPTTPQRIRGISWPRSWHSPAGSGTAEMI